MLGRIRRTPLSQLLYMENGKVVQGTCVGPRSKRIKGNEKFLFFALRRKERPQSILTFHLSFRSICTRTICEETSTRVSNVTRIWQNQVTLSPRYGSNDCSFPKRSMSFSLSRLDHFLQHLANVRTLLIAKFTQK